MAQLELNAKRGGQVKNDFAATVNSTTLMSSGARTSPVDRSDATTVSYRPSSRLLYVAAILTLLGLAAFWHGAFLVPLAGLLLFVALLAWRDARDAAVGLEAIQVRRDLPTIVGRGLPFQNIVSLVNVGTSSIRGEVRDVLPGICEPQWSSHDFELAPLGPEKSPRHQFTTTCRIPQRGRFSFGPIWVRVVGPRGFMEAQHPIPCLDTLKVLPETFASRDELQKDLGAQLLLLDKVMRSREVGAGTEFVSLFPYRQGDDPRRIDWRATARHRSPIVRRYQVERHRDVLILIDSGRLMGAMTDRGSKLDCAVDSALNLSRVVLHGGDRCGIGVFDSALRGFLAPLAGARALGSLVECVYGLQTNWQETDFTRMFAELQQRQTKRCLLVVLSDLGDHETSRLHCAALARLSRRHLVLFAALRTPLLRRVIHREPETVVEGARQAVAMGLLRDRGRALNALKHGGIHVLDVEPQQLTLPLINQFIELRQRNLL